MSRARGAQAWTWAQLLLAWLPVWLLFALGMQRVHGLTLHQSLHHAFWPVMLAGLLGLAVLRLTRRWDWPHPMTARFLLRHATAALAFCAVWLVADRLLAGLHRGPSSWQPNAFWWGYLLSGAWFYAVVVGVGYAQRAAAREAELRLAASQAQLAALSAQLQPHFLFNALHTVVQLIALDPPAARRAAELLAELLRRGITPPAEQIPLGEEWQATQRYLQLEALRFGERLQLEVDLPEAMLRAMVPSFALQTLVENAVAHGAAPRVAPTTLRLRAWHDGPSLCVEVSDDGLGTDLSKPHAGSGLRRLRERLALLHGDAADLQLESQPDHGFRARLRVPWRVA